ncbi:phage major capsid protein [Mycolicibacterium sphagni]|uniref:phage major capsid protein n=1 Tax=Mycolicibacterium sphagni TaxID=1786 RepID=UPI0021F37B18|nr:phage major capsid protein [Mycolicibacterium sphagni]MCV7179538.1 phage major capsid protein [Mycolicibacterium sphagni]
MPTHEPLIAQLEQRKDQVHREVIDFLGDLERRGLRKTDPLPEPSRQRFNEYRAQNHQLQQRIDELRDDDERRGDDNANLKRIKAKSASSATGSPGTGHDWARRAAHTMLQIAGEHRAVVNGSFDIPYLVEPTVSALPHPTRLIDLFTNRVTLESASYEFFKQTARSNAATAVADNATKPTSTLTTTPVIDRARVVAHLSEPAPIRLYQDQASLIDWLQAEMVAGVLDALEYQIISGDGSGENMTGLLHDLSSTTPGGTTKVPFTTDVITSLRSGLTALQVLGEQPNGWALHPADAQQIDLLRWSTGGGFLTGGYENDNHTGFGSSNNVFGTIPRVISPSVPQGYAVLGDWRQLRLYVREAINLMVDASGILFTKNQFIMRAEGRFGIGILRPQAFAVIDLTA